MFDVNYRDEKSNLWPPAVAFVRPQQFCHHLTT
jgi:hypothetical protein